MIIFIENINKDHFDIFDDVICDDNNDYNGDGYDSDNDYSDADSDN